MPRNHLVTRINGPWVSLLAVVLVIALLWAAKAVLLPLALGVILAFTLTPLVRVFDRIRLPRFLGVALTMALALGAVGGVGYVIADQFSDLSRFSPTRGAEARNYCRRIRAARPDMKLLVLRPLPDASDTTRPVARMKEAGADYVATSIQQALQEIGQLLAPQPQKPDALAVCGEPVEVV